MKRSRLGFARAVTAVAASALLLAGCAGSGTDAPDTPSEGAPEEGAEPAGEDPDEIILGLVPSQDLDELVEDADVLGDMVGEELGIPITTFISDNYAALVTAMRTGQADIGMFGPIALVQAADQADAEIVLQSVRFGSPTYHTQWFTNDPDTYCLTDVVEVEQDSGAIYTYCNGTDATDIGPVGEEALALLTLDTPISMVDASSASGYFYPATQVGEAAGIDPLALNVSFAGGHPNSLLNVARGDFPVGVSFDDARDNLVEEDPQIGETLTVFAFSDEIPNDGIALRGDLPADLRERITAAMLAVSETDDGAAAFNAVYNVTGLVPADLEALDAARAAEANFADD